ncbi:MAG: MFS transporter [Phycisphaerae bacterium]
METVSTRSAQPEPCDTQRRPVQSSLLGRGFLSLLTTQFFGAANDNILKGVIVFMVIDGVWKGQLGEGGQGIVGLCFSLPFIVLSGYAGQFADRHSKRDVSVMVKLIEIPITVVALIGFSMGNLWITLASLVALTSQSAFFGPAKYGMIPEIVDEGELSRANGTINMMTNVAAIVGTLAAGVISDRYSPNAHLGGAVVEPLRWLPGSVLLAVAVAGLASVLFLTRLEPGDRALKYDLNPLSTYAISLRKMAKSHLLMVALAWGYFYLLAGLALLIVPEYSVILSTSHASTSGLLGVLAVAIGSGSLAAGLISGHQIRPRLIPLGAFGMTVFFVLLGVLPPTFTSVALLILGAGFSAGFYIVPLQALLQKLSPDDERGRFLGTANSISFGFLTVASLLFWGMRRGFETFNENPQRIFLVCAGLMVTGSVFFLCRVGGGIFAKQAKAVDDG